MFLVEVIFVAVVVAFSFFVVKILVFLTFIVNNPFMLFIALLKGFTFYLIVGVSVCVLATFIGVITVSSLTIAFCITYEVVISVVIITSVVFMNKPSFFYNFLLLHIV